jgi:hypothetical protein
VTVRRRGAAAVCILAGILSGACTPVMQVSDMIPAETIESPAHMDKTLAIAPVRGGAPSESAMRVVANVEGRDYREALLATFRNSRLFREVRAGPQADLVLNTTIISQKVANGSKLYTLLVHYDVQESPTGRVLWRGDFYSDALGWDLYTSQLDTTWLARVRARTVQDNLRQLVAAVSEQLPRAVR